MTSSAPVAILLSLVIALSGACSTGRTSPAAPPSISAAASQTAELEFSLIQYRSDVATNDIQVKVRNMGDEPVVVTEVRFDSPSFVADAPVDKDARIAPGIAADLTVPLGEPVCDGTADDVTARVEVTLAGAADSISSDVDPGQLTELHVRGCQVTAVKSVVALDWPQPWTVVTDPGATPLGVSTLHIAVAAAAPGPVTVGPIRGTTLFSPATDQLPVTVAPGQSADPQIALLAARCDPHAVAEDKVGYLLPVDVSVAGADQVVVKVTVDREDRQPLQDLIDVTCGNPLTD